MGHLMLEIQKGDEDIAKAIHYPNCWDTMAYPSLASALWEIASGTIDGAICNQCNKKQSMRLVKLSQK